MSLFLCSLKWLDIQLELAFYAGYSNDLTGALAILMTWLILLSRRPLPMSVSFTTHAKP